MPSFAQALKTRIVADADVGAEVHWVKVPQGKLLPYTRLQVISDPRPQHLAGYNGARVTRVQVDCFAASWGSARDMAEEIIRAVATPAVVAGVRFGRTTAIGPRDLGEDVATTFVHRASLDLLVEHALA